MDNADSILHNLENVTMRLYVSLTKMFPVSTQQFSIASLVRFLSPSVTTRRARFGLIKSCVLSVMLKTKHGKNSFIRIPALIMPNSQPSMKNFKLFQPFSMSPIYLVLKLKFLPIPDSFGNLLILREKWTASLPPSTT